MLLAPSPTRLAAFLLVPLTAACSIRPATDPVDAPMGRTFTAEQIQETGARTAWDALRLFSGHVRTDNGRIASRGESSIHLSTEPLVVMDGVRLAEHGLLRNMSARQLASISFISGLHATTHYGTGASNGVLVIRTRVPGSPPPPT